MNPEFKSVALSGIVQETKNKKYITKIFKLLKDLKLEVFCDSSLRGITSSLDKHIVTKRNILNKSDLLISVGGDGAMLNNCKRLGVDGLPVLGINLGTLGFLTDIQTEELEPRLKEVLKGKYVLDKRPFLKAYLNNKELDSVSLNEIVLHSGSVAQMIEFSLYIDNSFVYKQKADGLIIFSPTGSTAYSLSGGGPLIDPALNLIGIMPMFPHSLNTTPILIGDHKEIRIDVHKNFTGQKSELSFDSQVNLVLNKDCSLKIIRTENEINLVHPVDDDFFARCRNKLGWGQSIT